MLEAANKLMEEEDFLALVRRQGQTFYSFIRESTLGRHHAGHPEATTSNLLSKEVAAEISWLVNLAR